MTNKIVYERDLLYPIDNENELGAIHLEVYGVGKNGKIQVVIENKSRYLLVKYIDSIINIMQSDVFNRLDVNVLHGVDINILADEEMKKLYGNRKYIKVVINDGNKSFEAIDEINI
ncbi:hypothetical protein [Acetivibrio cellulolyticus]|uniref:hypothetical protein n=1 Tax=Acetivibrio cellulolyticus TaxID=35830 RepID=UPI0001E2D518|nr:hypothetical protein [Acetivibrio cellulolyticus]